MDEVAIKVEGVHKEFKLPHEKRSSVKGMFVNLFRGSRRYERQQVLKGISFEVKKGEFFGIIGRNGSGKSTLLKMLAGIYQPNKGHIQVNGKLTPFIELGVGFNPELTGRENVYLNGALLGFNRKEMDAMYDDIVEFAELERFMDQQLKNYSSGMQVRLAFSIAIRAQSDILVLDEVLAVGDEAFQKKCYEYFAKLKGENTTVILVTHDMNSVQRFCDRAMLIDGGKIVSTGGTGKVTKAYEDINKRTKTAPEQAANKKSNSTSFELDVNLLNDKKQKVTEYYPEDKIVIDIKLKSKINIKDAFVGITLQKPDGEYVYWLTTERESIIKEFTANKLTELTLELQNIFGENTYALNVSVKSNDRTKEYLIADSAASFTVTGRGKSGWMLHPDYKLLVRENV